MGQSKIPSGNTREHSSSHLKKSSRRSILRMENNKNNSLFLFFLYPKQSVSKIMITTIIVFFFFLCIRSKAHRADRVRSTLERLVGRDWYDTHARVKSTAKRRSRPFSPWIVVIMIGGRKGEEKVGGRWWWRRRKEKEERRKGDGGVERSEQGGWRDVQSGMVLGALEWDRVELMDERADG